MEISDIVKAQGIKFRAKLYYCQQEKARSHVAMSVDPFMFNDEIFTLFASQDF